MNLLDRFTGAALAIAALALGACATASGGGESDADPRADDPRDGGPIDATSIDDADAANAPDADTTAGLPRISYWYGKVNLHKPVDGAWTHDPDCTSGALEDPLEYCQKWFPATVTVTEVALSPKPDNVWYNAMCQETATYPGLQEWTCNP